MTHVIDGVRTRITRHFLIPGDDIVTKTYRIQYAYRATMFQVNDGILILDKALRLVDRQASSLVAPGFCFQDCHLSTIRHCTGRANYFAPSPIDPAWTLNVTSVPLYSRQADSFLATYNATLIKWLPYCLLSFM